ncbi:hypothetical protein JCM10212_006862 [Sporobolomyces blumeae]
MVIPLDLPCAPPPPPAPFSPPPPPSSPSLSSASVSRPNAPPSPRRSPAAVSTSSWTSSVNGGPLPRVPRSRAAMDGPPVAGPSTPTPAQLDLSLLPLSPLPSHLAPFLHPKSPLSSAEKRSLFTSVYLRSASAGHADTLEWLLSIPPDPTLSSQENAAAARRFSLTTAQLNNVMDGPAFVVGAAGGGSPKPTRKKGPTSDAEREASAIVRDLSDDAPRKWVELEATDEEGNTALGLCVALGHAEAVRVLVEGGVKVTQQDQAGWTPLHWAVQNNDIPIASYLLNHRASPLIASYKGLTPRDLVKVGKEGTAMREVLKSAWEAALERERAKLAELELDGFDDGDGDGDRAGSVGKGKAREHSNGSGSCGARPGSRLSIASSLAALSWVDEREKEEDVERDRDTQRRTALALESARHLDVDVAVLALDDDGLCKAEPDDDGDLEGIQIPFEWDRCLPDQMIVFTLDDLPILFDVVITTIRTTRTRKYRVIPANVLFLCARFAHHLGTPELLEELVIGAMERIEAAVHHRPDDMANCAFWLSNTLLLLYYLRKEPSLAASTSTYQLHLCDLINEIFVFVIRDAERRIDRVLEPAMLEHEPLAGFEDVAFEGEWGTSRFVKKLTGRGRKASNNIRSSTSAMSLFSVASGNEGGAAGDTSLDSIGTASPPPNRASRIVSASFIPPSASSSAAEATPASVTSLLSSTLFVLQLYEIPPSIVVQAFSQLFYWIACEVFNRLLTQRKYLCRSRAMQIRLNASNLEDWARASRLPAKMVSVHFAPLNHLLQWLQCLSSESSIDGLIGTIQSLRSLNPLQLRKAVRDYRYEVDETKMDDECAEYLVQIQRQWEKHRMQKTVDGLSSPVQPPTDEPRDAAAGADEDAAQASLQADAARMIDDVFADSGDFASYAPPAPVEAMGELLNSRYMLPFAVPSAAELLIHFDQPEAFGPFAMQRTRTKSGSLGDPTTPRSTSRLSFASSAQPSDGQPSPHLSDRATLALPGAIEPFVPLLPDDFFAVWDSAKARASARNLHGGGANGNGLPYAVSGVGEDWRTWRDGMPDDGDEDEDGASESGSDVDDSGEGSVIYRPIGGRGGVAGGGDDSFESVGNDSLTMETPRMKSGFQ